MTTRLLLLFLSFLPSFEYFKHCGKVLGKGGRVEESVVLLSRRNKLLSLPRKYIIACIPLLCE